MPNSESPLRRTPPPPFRTVKVTETEELSPRMMRVVLSGESLEGLEIEMIASSVRLVVPWPGEPFAVPTWNGNEFLLTNGRRPALRTFTPVMLVDNTLALDIVRHRGGAVSDWVEATKPGDQAAVSGPGRGTTIDLTSARYVILGDETAIPAIRQLLAAMPVSLSVETHIEIATPEAKLPMPREATWHIRQEAASPGHSLLEVARLLELGHDDRIWAAGEAAAMHALRKLLFADRGIKREHATIRGYWKVPRPAR